MRGIGVLLVAAACSGGSTTPGDGGESDAGTDSANAGLSVDAGADVTVTLPVSSVALAATAQDGVGKITTWAWTETAGAPATIANADTATPTLFGLTLGNYTFSITVTDDHGVSASDTVAVVVAAGATHVLYYVDATTGDDTHDGTSPATAWKSLAKVDASAFVAGDVVSFARGGVFRGRLVAPSSGSPQNPITFDSYGSGASPIVSGSVLLPSSGWSAQATNVWKRAYAASTKMLAFDGHLGRQVTSVATLVQAYDWWLSGGTLYVYAAADPGTTYAAPGIEVASEDRVFDTNGHSNLEVDDLVFRDAAESTSGDGAVRVGPTATSNVTLRRCTVERNRGPAIELSASTQLAGITITDSVVQNNGGFGVVFYALSTAHNVVTKTKLASNGWASDIDGAQQSNVQGALGNVEISYCEIVDAAPVAKSTFAGQSHGIYVSTPGGVADIHHNTIHGNTNGAGIKVRFDANIHENVIYENAYAGVEAGGNGATAAKYDVWGNAFYGGKLGFPSISESARGSGQLTMTITNNTCYKDGTAFASTKLVSIADDLAGPLTIENDIMYASNDHGGLEVSAQSGALVIDYNLYFRDNAGGAPANVHAGITYATMADWQAHGFDTHGINANPLLVGPPTDMHLEAASPAIDKGTNVGRPFDGAAPDMGAFER